VTDPVEVATLPSGVSAPLMAAAPNSSALQLAEDWDLSAARLDHPFLCSGWLHAWWDVFGTDEPNVDGALLSGWPLHLRHGGRELSALANVHTPISGRLRPLEPVGSETPWAIHRSADRIVWPSLNHSEALALAASLRDSGWAAIVEPQRHSPIVEMQDDHDTYARSRRRDLRQRAGRLHRKLVREHDAQFQLIEPNWSRTLYRACLQLEASGWKGRNRTAILSDPRTARFYDAVANMPASRLSVITVSGAPIAFALCQIHGDRLYLLKTAYDERYRQLSPGLVLHWAIIDKCHTLGLSVYELLGSADTWKLQLAAADRPISRLVAHKGTPTGRARSGLRRLRPLAKSIHHQLSGAGRTTKHGGRPNT
jgi:CelD/BcsL family acetyltransferase involved in cellulose biosynthesis